MTSESTEPKFSVRGDGQTKVTSTLTTDNIVTVSAPTGFVNSKAMLRLEVRVQLAR